MPVLKNLSSILLSVLLAVLVWVAAVREQNPPQEADYGQSLPIEVISPSPGLVTVDPVPETVRLRLLAPQSSWESLSPSKFKVSVDLSQLPAGFNDVPVEVSVSDREVEIVRQTPQVVTVNLQAEETITKPVEVKILDDPPLGYISRAPVAEPDVVTITGPTSLVDQVDEAVVEMLIRNARETIERTLPVQIQDSNDEIIDALRVSPEEIQVRLPIEQRFGYKEVAVSASVAGQAAPGYWVSNILVDPPRITVVGNPRVLSSISGAIRTVPVNVDQATEDIVQVVPLNLPDGATVVMPEGESLGANGVEVTVEVSAIESGQTIQRPIVQQGIAPHYTWTVSPQRADVILSGPIPRLQTLQPSDVTVIVDLFGLEPGVYSIRPTVFLPDDLRVEAILPDTVEVTISLATPTPVATPSTRPTPTPNVSPR